MYANTKLRVAFVALLSLSCFGTPTTLRAESPGCTVTTDGNVTATLHLAGNADPINFQ
jgi:hypothetical protein